MWCLSVLIWGFFAVSGVIGHPARPSTTAPTKGIYDLVRRRIPQHANSFHFSLTNATVGNTIPSSATDKPNDQYVISTGLDGKIWIEGNTLSALSSGYALSFNIPPPLYA